MSVSPPPHHPPSDGFKVDDTFVSSTDKVSGLKTAALIMGILYTVGAVIQVFGLAAVSMVNPQRCRFRISSVTYSG